LLALTGSVFSINLFLFRTLVRKFLSADRVVFLFKSEIFFPGPIKMMCLWMKNPGCSSSRNYLILEEKVTFILRFKLPCFENLVFSFWGLSYLFLRRRFLPFENMVINKFLFLIVFIYYFFLVIEKNQYLCAYII